MASGGGGIWERSISFPSSKALITLSNCCKSKSVYMQCKLVKLLYSNKSKVCKLRRVKITWGKNNPVYTCYIFSLSYMHNWLTFLNKVCGMHGLLVTINVKYMYMYMTNARFQHYSVHISLIPSFNIESH